VKAVGNREKVTKSKKESRKSLRGLTHSVREECYYVFGARSSSRGGYGSAMGKEHDFEKGKKKCQVLYELKWQKV